MRKVAINRCYGGFGLSSAAVLRYGELKGITLYHVPDKFCDSYYLCPPEEYEAVYAEDCKNQMVKVDLQLLMRYILV